VLEAKLKNVRYALTKEAGVREKLQKERDMFCKKLAQLREFLTEDLNEQQQLGPQNGLRSHRDRVMSALNDLPVMETLHEVDSTEHSLSDLEFDKTEDDVLGQSRHSSRRRSHNRSSNRRSNSRREDGNQSKNNSKRSRIGEDFPLYEADIDVEMAEEAAAAPITEKRTHRALFRSETVCLNHVKSPGLSVTATPISSTPELGKLIQAQQSPRKTAENRTHSFVSKKVFRPGEKCGPCGGAIRFCNNCFRCSHCMVTCHPECKDKVANPCIPFISRTRSGRMTLISDYVSDESPKIPALIFHCCNEIEKRGLSETGLYRVPGSDKDVRDLKEKILKSKKGMPSLASYDVHVICSVVKDFLRSVDEPLVSRVLWRDFVKASEISDQNERKNNLYQAISELPEANRNTLAFVICHLQRVAEAPAVKMPKASIAKVFGPSIVGHSMSSPPPVEMMAEIKKQICVMHMLLDTPGTYWNSFLSQNGEAAEQPVTESGRRLSGGRTFGGSVQTNGILTPHKSVYQATLQKPLYLKPLF
jgi:Rac GTPase-activating protein 1